VFGNLVIPRVAVMIHCSDDVAICREDFREPRNGETVCSITMRDDDKGIFLLLRADRRVACFIASDPEAGSGFCWSALINRIPHFSYNRAFATFVVKVKSGNTCFARMENAALKKIPLPAKWH